MQKKPEIDYKPLSGRDFPRFSAIKTFFRLPYVDMDADYDVAIAGVPYDGSVSYRPGARFAPSQIRETSSLGRGAEREPLLLCWPKTRGVRQPTGQYLCGTRN